MDIIQKRLREMEKKQPSTKKITLKDRLIGGSEFKGRKTQLKPREESHILPVIGKDKPLDNFLHDLEYLEHRSGKFLSERDRKYAANATRVMKNLTPEQIIKLKLLRGFDGKKLSVQPDDIYYPDIYLAKRFIEAFYNFRKRKYLKETIRPIHIPRYDCPIDKKQLEGLTPKIRELYTELHNILKDLSYRYTDDVLELEWRVSRYIEKASDPNIVDFLLNEIKESKDYDDAVRRKEKEIKDKSKYSKLLSHAKDLEINGEIDRAIKNGMREELDSFKRNLSEWTPPIFSSDSHPHYLSSRIPDLLSYNGDLRKLASELSVRLYKF